MWLPCAARSRTIPISYAGTDIPQQGQKVAIILLYRLDSATMSCHKKSRCAAAESTGSSISLQEGCQSSAKKSLLSTNTTCMTASIETMQITISKTRKVHFHCGGSPYVWGGSLSLCVALAVLHASTGTFALAAYVLSLGLPVYWDTTTVVPAAELWLTFQPSGSTDAVILVPRPGNGPGSFVTSYPRALIASAVLYTSCSVPNTALPPHAEGSIHQALVKCRNMRVETMWLKKEL